MSMTTTTRTLCNQCEAELTSTDWQAGYCTQCGYGLRPQRSETMGKPRGHSNVYANHTQPHPQVPDKALIPIVGGASVYTVKDLPPLALSRDEWQEIGERMGWAKYRLTADREQRA